MRILLTGGVKSGKSFRALQIARTEFVGPVAFVATSEVLDEEMRERIDRHRRERMLSDGSPEFRTIEEPLELASALRSAGSAAIVDCLPMWINNLMFRGRQEHFESMLEDAIAALPQSCVVVTNETGLGNIPFDETTRRYNRLLAEANRRIAQAADRVEFLVSGIPLRVK